MVLFLLAAAVLAEILRARLIEEFDAVLLRAAKELVSNVEDREGVIQVQVPQEFPKDLAWVLVRSDGAVVQYSSDAAGRTLSAIDLGRTTAAYTMAFDDGTYRIVGLLISLHGRDAGQVYVARSLASLPGTLATLRDVLLLEGVAIVLLSAAAGYVLAGRAVAPIVAARAREQAFLADASHELRTPLAVATTGIELLLRDPGKVPDEVQRDLNDVLAELRRLERLVGDLATLTRADQGRLSLDRAPVEVSQLVEQAAHAFRHLATKAGVALQIEPAPPAVVIGDDDRLLQVLRILVDNAIKHTPSGGTVTVQAQVSIRTVRLMVRDSGVGIPPEHLPHVFERFYRVDAARQRNTGGTGLGLAIAHSIVVTHGGTITAASTSGKGTTMVVTLPRAA